MKRGCLIALVAVPVLLIAGLFYAYHYVSSNYGLSPASKISHESAVTSQTRFRLVIERDPLVPFLESFLPAEGIKTPWYASFFVKDPIEEILPYEVALIGGADYKANEYATTLFVNERILGPAIVTLGREFIEQQRATFKTIKTPEAEIFNLIKWQENYLKDDPRGALTLNIGVPLPAGLEKRVLKNWAVNKDPSKEGVEGGHLVEAVLDNFGGDLMALIGTAAKLNGQSLEQTFGFPQTELAVKAIDTIRLTADLTGDDELTLVVRVALNSQDFMLRAPFQAVSNAVIDGSSMLETLANMAMNQPPVSPDQAQFKGLKTILAPYGVTADFKGGEKPVIDTNNVLIASYVVSGFRPLLQTQLDTLLSQLAAMQK